MSKRLTDEELVAALNVAADDLAPITETFSIEEVAAEFGVDLGERE